MNLPLVLSFAGRYLRGKGKGNAVPILSRISMLAIAIGSCALIVIFSVFNGFEGLIKNLYRAFYPDINISPARGKFFSISKLELDKVISLKGIDRMSATIEDNVFVSTGDDQLVATLRGIDTSYMSVNGLAPFIIAGRDTLDRNGYTAVIGEHIAGRTGVNVNSPMARLSLYYPDGNDQSALLNPQTAFRTLDLKPDGVFRVQDDFDAKYILASLQKVQELFGAEGKFSSLQLKLAPGADELSISVALKNILGKDFKIATRYQQNQSLYLVMHTEKWAVYAILLLVLVIASFNMVGGLSLLVIEKQKDTSLLRAMGTDRTSSGSIFFLEGVLWAFIGGSIGILLGFVICLGQQHFHWLKLAGNFIIDAYPVVMQPGDFLLVMVTVVVIGALAAVYPTIRASRQMTEGLRGN